MVDSMEIRLITHFIVEKTYSDTNIDERIRRLSGIIDQDLFVLSSFNFE